MISADIILIVIGIISLLISFLTFLDKRNKQKQLRVCPPNQKNSKYVK